MTNNPVGWFEIYVQDLKRAKAFYEAVLQVTLEKLNSPESLDLEMWAFPMAHDKPGAPGALAKMNGVPSGGTSTLVYFSCADCGVEAGRVVAAGRAGASKGPRNHGFSPFFICFMHGMT